MPSYDQFEIPDRLTVLYSYGYGAITPFFEAIAAESETLRITRCERCGVSYCPPRHQCSSCWQETTWIDHDGRGVLESLVWAYWMPIDSPARAWTDLPYAYGAVRLDDCANLMTVRITGVERSVDLTAVTGSTGQMSICPGATGLVGDLVFDLDSANGRTG